MAKTNTGGVRLMREDIEFKASDGTVLRGWHYRPDEPSAAPHPVIVISHGYGAVKEMALEVFAQQFSGAGLACLVYDQRCFGDSDGQPRQEIAPFVQVSDTHDAVTFASGLAGVDPARVGLWGTSYSGGHSLQVARPIRGFGVSSPRYRPSAVPATPCAAFLATHWPKRSGPGRRIAPHARTESSRGWWP